MCQWLTAQHRCNMPRAQLPLRLWGVHNSCKDWVQYGMVWLEQASLQQRLPVRYQMQPQLASVQLHVAHMQLLHPVEACD